MQTTRAELSHVFKENSWKLTYILILFCFTQKITIPALDTPILNSILDLERTQLLDKPDLTGLSWTPPCLTYLLLGMKFWTLEALGNPIILMCFGYT